MRKVDEYPGSTEIPSLLRSAGLLGSWMDTLKAAAGFSLLELATVSCVGGKGGGHSEINQSVGLESE